MSVMILGGAHANRLAAAAAQFGVVGPEQAPELAHVLLAENIDAYLLAYWEGPSTFDDWDELDEDERDDELVQIRAMQLEHRYDPSTVHPQTPAAIREAVESWQYQVGVIDDREHLSGWQTMTRLLDALPGPSA